MRVLSTARRLVAAAFRPYRFPARWVSHPRYPGVRDGILAVVLTLYGVAAALIVLEPWRSPAPALTTVRLGDTKVPVGEPRSPQLLHTVRGLLKRPVMLKGPGFEHKMTWAELGAEVDMDLLRDLLAELSVPDSPAARAAAELKSRGVEPSIEAPLRLGEQTAVEALISFKDLVDKAPVSARFDFVGDKVLEERSGVQLDVYETLDRLERALGEGRGEVELAVTEVKAETTHGQLAEIEVDEVIGFFETPYSRQKKDENRTHNVKLASSLLDGHIIMPGQTFSLNEVVGDRTQARGFRYAPVIAGGVLQEGMGGGTCQIASTVYAASFFAGLIVVERRPHSRPSSYIKLGLDATVSYPNLDLKLQNPFDFPVALHLLAEGGNLRVEVRGAERPFTVTLLRHVVGTQGFPTRTIDEPLLPSGRSVISQIGVPGYTVRRYQIIERDKVAYRFQIMDKYPPTAQIVRRGTAPSREPLPGAPKADPHSPYNAAYYLRMVQGPGGLWYEQSHD